MWRRAHTLAIAIHAMARGLPPVRAFRAGLLETAGITTRGKVEFRSVGRRLTAGASAGSLPCESRLVPERRDWVDTRRCAGGQVAGNRRAGRERCPDEKVGQGIGRRDVEQEMRHQKPEPE